jgi:alcohol dehydrogenase class IV
MRFEFATATEIVFGAGIARDLAARVPALGRRLFVVTGGDASRTERVLAPLAAGIAGSFRLDREPTLDDARQATAAARACEADAVLAVGGGSVIDLGKATAALLTNTGDPLEYVEVIGGGLPLAAASVPFIAVPTTAGTGSEVTRNAVLASPGDGIKVSLRSPRMLARLAIVDPELTRDLPPELTASTGMDALTQLIEPMVSVRATPLVDAICREALPRVSRSLTRAVQHGADAAAREEMAFASLCGGLALANAGLGVVHGVAAAVGGRYDAPHGAVCAALLPGAVTINLRALGAREPRNPAVRRYSAVAALLTGGADAGELARWVETLRDDLEIPGLGTYGIRRTDVPALAAAASRASSTRGHPSVLTDEEQREVIERAL